MKKRKDGMRLMAEIHISHDLMLRIQAFAREAGQTPEEVVQEAIADFIASPPAHLVTLPDESLLPPYGSKEEDELLDSLRNRLVSPDNAWSKQIIEDRGL